MEIKANSWYRTRGGAIAYVAGVTPESRSYPVIGCDKGDAKSWTLCGRYIEGDVDGRDLVEHLPDCDSFGWKPSPKIQVEAGKKYVLANGHVVGPMLYAPVGIVPKYYSNGNEGCMWFENGGRVALSDRPHENIVSEYIEPEPTYEPWDFDSMPGLVKVVSKTNNEFRTSYLPHGDCAINAYGTSLSYSELFAKYVQLDGTPCGRVKQC